MVNQDAAEVNSVARVTLREVLPAWEEALRLEIQAAKETGRRYLITGGQRLGRLHGDEVFPFLYAFTMDADVYLPDDAPIKIHLDGRSWDGVLVSQTGFDITVALRQDLGENIPRAELSCEPWELLEELIERLREAALQRTRNWRLADLLLQGGPPVPGYRGKVLVGQDTALKHALENPVTFIWGPPGTGKTNVIAAIAHQMLCDGKRTLIVSHSNVAVDNAILRIWKRFPSAIKDTPGAVLRWGFVRLKELQDRQELHSIGLLRMRYPHLDHEERRWREETRRLRQLINEGRTELRQALAEAEEAWRYARERLREQEAFLVQQARTLGVTLSRAAAKALVYNDNTWDCVILDEASMAYVPQVAYAATLAKEHIIVVGDFKQLAPIVLSRDDRVEEHLGKDIFEFVGISKLISEGRRWHPHLVMLDRQFRSHPAITEWPRKVVYSFGKNGQSLLKDGKPASEFAQITSIPPFPNSPLVLIDTSHLRPYVFSANQSRFSPWTAVMAVTLASQASGSKASVGVISPFAAQSRLTLALLRDLFPDITGQAREVGDSPIASTIHRFQGYERDVIIIDLVDSWPKEGPAKLLTDSKHRERLINVAITRARGKLIILADLDYLTGNSLRNGRLGRSNPIRMFLEHAQRQQVVDATQIIETLPAIGPVRWFRSARALKDWRKDLRNARRYVTIVLPSIASRDYNQNLPRGNGHDPVRLSLKRTLQRIRSGISVRVYCDDPEYAQSICGSGVSIYYWSRSFQDPVTVVDGSLLWLGYPPTWSEDPDWSPLRDVTVRWEGREGILRLLDLWRLPSEDTAHDHAAYQPASALAGLYSWVWRKLRCPQCSSPARLVVKSWNAFVACSRGPARCRWIEVLPPDELQEFLNGVTYRCPLCGSATVARLNRRQRSVFIGCAAFPGCYFTISVADAIRGRTPTQSAT